jgi:hypothetical protein
MTNVTILGLTPLTILGLTPLLTPLRAHGRGLASPAAERARESRPGLVAAPSHNGAVALGERATGDGPLHARDAGGQPDGAQSRPQASPIADEAAGSGKGKRTVKNDKCHNSRTDPFTGKGKRTVKNDKCHNSRTDPFTGITRLRHSLAVGLAVAYPL